jgi:hypothetical protein
MGAACGKKPDTINENGQTYTYAQLTSARKTMTCMRITFSICL